MVFSLIEMLCAVTTAFNKKNTGVMEVLKSTVAEIFSTYPCSLILCSVLFETAQESNKDQYYLHFDNKAKYIPTS